MSGQRVWTYEGISVTPTAWVTATMKANAGRIRLIWTYPAEIREVCRALTELGIEYVVLRRPGGVSIISTLERDRCACPKCGGSGISPVKGGE